MNLAELKSVLEREDFNPRSYSLDCRDQDLSLCLNHKGGRWYVYCSERGLCTGMVEFDSEEVACEYFLEKLREDPTARRGYVSAIPLPPLKRPED